MTASSIGIDDKILDDLMKVPVPRIFKEFKSLKREANLITNVAFDNNKRKNRYNIPVADETRCILKSGVYINANHVTSGSTGVKLIAAEAPKKKTLDAFCQLIFDHDVSQIIMLCSFEEDGNEKCYQYLKGNNQHQISKNFSINCCEEQLIKFEKNGAIAIIKVSKLHLTNTSTKENKYVDHFHLLAWPDHEIPLSMESLIYLYQVVLPKSTTANCLVHCSASIGRTGTFIGGYFMYEQFIANNLSSVKEAIVQLRQQRNKAIQTDLQYLFLHLLFVELLLAKNVDVKKEKLTFLKRKFMLAVDENRP